jgi:DNA-binding winged helix-turn-helix (wHTH) protein
VTAGRRFGDIVFEDNFLFATREPEGELKFTRSERAVLIALAGNARKVMSRNQLLDAIAGTGSDSTDRNIDFLINRLRAKLGDSARAPRFIATQYGEGYVWIAEPNRPAANPQAQEAQELLIFIGPVFGLDRLADAGLAEAMLARLHAALVTIAGSERRVALARQRGLHATPPNTRFTLELGFYCDGGPLHLAAILHEGRSGRIVRAQRLILNEPSVADIEELARTLKAAMWDHRSFGTGPVAALTDEPLEVRLHNASLMFTQAPSAWIETEAQARRALAERPDDPETMLAAAMCIYSRRLSAAIPMTNDEEEIERLVFASLPRIGNSPILALAAAKLLLFVGRGHLALAEAIAEQAFAESTAFASAFATLGQIRVCAGDIEAGLDLYERGIELCTAGSEFHLYLLVLKCIACLASGNRQAVERSLGQLYAVKPQTQAELGILFAPPDEAQLPPLLKAILGKLDAGHAQFLIRHAHYISARLYQHEAHRENIMRGFLSLAVGRFGAAVVPDEVRRSVPKLMAELQI